MIFDFLDFNIFIKFEIFNLIINFITNYLIIVVKDNCCDSDIYFEIRFPNDTNVPMKLFLLGGLIDAMIIPYWSSPEVKTNNTRNYFLSNNSFYIVYAIILIIIVVYSIMGIIMFPK